MGFGSIRGPRRCAPFPSGERKLPSCSAMRHELVLVEFAAGGRSEVDQSIGNWWKFRG